MSRNELKRREAEYRKQVDADPLNEFGVRTEYRIYVSYDPSAIVVESLMHLRE